jgi:hypothetical protein
MDIADDQDLDFPLVTRVEVVDAVASSDCLHRPVYYEESECYWCEVQEIRTLSEPWDEDGIATRGFSILRHAPDCVWTKARWLLDMPGEVFSGPEPWATMHITTWRPSDG